MGVRYGLKLWSSDAHLVDSALDLIDRDLFQYIELTPIPGTEIDPFLSLDIPFVIHATTERHGVNIADKSRIQLNRTSLSWCLSWAEQLNADCVVLHPGFGNLSDAVGFLDGCSDIRILIENMPAIGLDQEKMIGSTPNEIRELMRSRFGFCLDLNHAVKAAISLQKSYQDFIREFLVFKPALFHIADGSLVVETDEHLALGSGRYNLKFLKCCIEESVSRRLTFETPRFSEGFHDDILNLERFKDL